MKKFNISFLMAVQYLLFLVVYAWCCARLVWHGWAADDAYVTFRVVDNFVHGYGLRWNIDERVQAYSNPLWLLIHIPFYMIWPHIADVTIMLGYACAAVSLLLGLLTMRLTPLAAALWLLPVGLSPTLRAYFSSGLENPMSMLLFSAFVYVLLRRRKSAYYAFWLSLIVALASVNRMDSALVYVPVGLYLVWSHRPVRREWAQIMLGALPLAAWLLFSLFYYGFFFPNTKYAKLGVGIGLEQYLRVGTNYMLEFMLADPLAAVLVLTVGGYALLRLLPRFLRGKRGENALWLALALGMILYCIYVLCVGGSFVSCRFMSLQVWMALSIAGTTLLRRIDRRPLLLAVVALNAVALHALAATPWVHSERMKRVEAGTMFINSGAKWWWHPHSALLTLDRKPRMPWCEMGAPLHVEVITMAGLRAYYERPPCSHLIDVWALGDPLLAHLPSYRTEIKRIGHLSRYIPKGYPEALRSGSLETLHPKLAEYYRPLKLITQGDLWSWERIKAIIWFNLGKYDHWRDEFVAETGYLYKDPQR